MATTLYIRTTGNDNNSGTSGSPFRSAQKGFEVAYNGTGDYILDFGTGSFGGITLSYVPYQTLNWPSRISVKGAGSSSSFLGGINGNGIDSNSYYVYNPGIGGYESEDWPATNGANINITSDGTINLGDITTLGGVQGGYEGNAPYCADAGNITLNNCIAGNISAYGHDDGSSSCDPGTPGSVTLTNYSTVSSVNVHGGNDNNSGSLGFGGGSSGGNITLTNHSTVTGSINISAGQGYSINEGSCDGSIGVYTHDSTSSVGSVIANTGSNPIGSCGYCSTDYAGCNNSTACNYDSGASCDDGSCYWICNDTNARNYHDSCNPCWYVDCNDYAACNTDGNSFGTSECTYPIDACHDCGGNCICDSDLCGNCNNYHGGCTDGAACSGTDSCANYDDGSCQYDYGCGCGSGWNGTILPQYDVLNGVSYNVGQFNYVGTLQPGTSKAKVILSATLGVPIF
jgi:hypothetical protein